MYQQDTIVKDSDNQFRLRIDSYLRGTGIYQIVGTIEYMEIIFVGGHWVRITYPRKV